MSVETTSKDLHLPQELLDEIIGALADENDLKTCSVVAQAFRTPSQRRLFAEITLHCQGSLHALEQLGEAFVHSPELALHTRSLRLETNVYDPQTRIYMYRPLPVPATIFIDVIRKLGNVTQLTLRARGESGTVPSRWANCPAGVTDIFQAPLRFFPIKSLRLHDIYFASGKELMLFIGGHTAASLKSLHLANVWVESQNHHIDPGASLPRLSENISSLSLHASYNLTTTLIASGSWENLQSLTLRVDRGDSSPQLFAMLQKLLDDAASSISYFQLCVHSGTRSYHLPMNAVTHYDLSMHNLALLRTLEMSFTVDEPAEHHLIRTSLSSAAAFIAAALGSESTSIERIILTFPSVGVHVDLPHKLIQIGMDTALIPESESSQLRLKQVMLRFPGCKFHIPGTFFIQEIHANRYLTAFPTIAQRGILRMTVN
ncbi:hypothetical protein C8F01DRAFT_722847 [Mycena amicta]|nr:hypothetical protein C8F01DRAFT_722847 [Mycena amicta]